MKNRPKSDATHVDQDHVSLPRKEKKKPKIGKSSALLTNGTAAISTNGHLKDDSASELDDTPLSRLQQQQHKPKHSAPKGLIKKQKQEPEVSLLLAKTPKKPHKKLQNGEVKEEPLGSSKKVDQKTITKGNTKQTKGTKSTKLKGESTKRPSTSAPKSEDGSPKKKKPKKEPKEELPVWKWWEEEKLPDGVKWKFLEHNGPMFAPAYEPLPDSVTFKYDDKVMKLSEATEEVATFYGKMLDHDYTSKDVFNTNFFKDWRSVMTPSERQTIKQLEKCDFRAIDIYFKELSEKRKNRSKEEKEKEKEAKELEQKQYGFATIDGYQQKIGNYRIEPPGLFRGRGDHPRMGQLKKRTHPEDVIINCSSNAKVPSPPDGHRWKAVQQDNSVSWLATWTENVLGLNKYVMLNPSSKMKGEKDHEKYEKARKLKTIIGTIRKGYEDDLKSKEMRVRQRAVALYFIDKLALRAGNEKEDGEGADTVGCCSLRFEHIKLQTEQKADGSTQYVVEFDFLGKDSIRYLNSVSIPKRVYKNLELFMDKKKTGDDLFDRLNTAMLNKHLQDTMEGLTAKVFRTYNASITLQEQLAKLTNANDTLPTKMLSYNRANRQVAILCNHQRAIPKSFDKSMENLETKIKEKREQIAEAEKALKEARSSAGEDRAKRRLEQKKDQLKKLKIQRTDKDENKDIALGTSKLNYLDPRISVAWCKKFGVPIERVYNKTQREKFRWAIEMTEDEFEF